MKVCLHLADGFEEIEAITVVDILRRAEIDVQMVSLMGRKEVLGAHQIPVMADILFGYVDYSRIDMMILPGGGQGTKNMSEHAAFNQQITKFAKDNKWIAAICAAPMVLGKLGLLAGKSATCYPGCESQLTGADVSSTERVVLDDKIITSRGPGTSFDFALKIVEVLKGIEAATRLKEEMLICG